VKLQGVRPYDDFHRAMQQHLSAGAYEAAATLGLERLGPEIMGFLMSMTRDETAAGEVFSDFCEDMWRGLPAFRGEASFRTWAYTLARHAAYRHQRDPYRRRRVNLSNHPVLAELEARIRTTTLQHLRSEVREAVTRLRERLKPDDQALLVLRIDRGMSFQDIAVVLSGGPLDEVERKERAAALRKRVERLKVKLREMAEAEGLLRREA
jgi:RNA polymerase sigma-70 factor (ECF subfamily)